MKPIAFALAASVLFAAPLTAHEYEAGSLTIDHPWARPSLGANPNSAAYLMIDNRGETGDRLLSAATPVAERVELHTHLMEGSVMRMRRVEDGVQVPSGGQVEFKPGGYHVMLFGVRDPLEVGEEFPMTLTFEKAGTVEVTVIVEPVSGPKADAHKGHSMDHGEGAHGGHHPGHPDESGPETPPEKPSGEHGSHEAMGDHAH